MSTTRLANVSVSSAMADPESIEKLTQQHKTLFFNIICQASRSFPKRIGRMRDAQSSKRLLSGEPRLRRAFMPSSI